MDPAQLQKLMRTCPSPLAATFFSARNVDVIQRELARAVRARTGHAIDRQSDAEVAGIMRGVYEAYARTVSTVRELNDMALEILVDQVAVGVEAHLQYLKDASTLPEPMPRGAFASIKGERSLTYARPGV